MKQQLWSALVVIGCVCVPVLVFGADEDAKKEHAEMKKTSRMAVRNCFR